MNIQPDWVFDLVSRNFIMYAKIFGYVPDVGVKEILNCGNSSATLA